MHQKKNTILIIEDELPIRKVLTIALESAGYKVVDCDKGREGMRLAASIGPELILLDLGLPDIDGKEVIAGKFGYLVICNLDILNEHVFETNIADFVGTTGPVRCVDLLTDKEMAFASASKVQLVLAKCAAYVLMF